MIKYLSTLQYFALDPQRTWLYNIWLHVAKAEHNC